MYWLGSFRPKRAPQLWDARVFGLCLATRLFASAASVGFLDFLYDATEVVSFWSLQRRVFFIRQQVSEPELLSDRQHVPVVDEGG